MVVITTPQKVSVNIKLSDGLKPDGSVNTKSISLGTLSVNHYDDTKALAVVGALEDCLDKAIYRVEKTSTATIEEE